MLLWGAFGLVVAIAVADASLALKRRQSLLALVVAMAALISPVALLQATQRDLGLAWLAGAYLVVAAVLAWWRTRLRGWGDDAGVVGYSLALLTSLTLAIFSGSATLLPTALLVALMLYSTSRLERQPQLVFLVVICAYLGLAQLITVRQWPEGAYAAILLLAGAAFYTLGFIRRDSDPGRAQAFRYGGLLGPFLGMLLGLTGGTSQTPILALGTGGILLWTESNLQGSRSRQELAGVLLLATYNWLLSYSQVTEVQVYSLPWAAYFAYLGVRRRGEADSTAHDIFVAIALAALTLPIAVQALGDNGLFYGLELIFVGLALMMVGSSQLNRLVLWWGGGTAGIIALYTLPKYLAPHTSLPAIAPLLGLAAFAITVMVYNRYR